MLLGFIDGQPVELSARDRSVHLLLIGASKTGKTTTMEFLARQDIKAGRGLCLIDPMGALYERLVAYYCYQKAIGCHVPEVILFNPSAGDWVLPYNPFIARGGDLSVQVDRRVQATLRAWRQHSGDETPRLEKWLKCIYTVLIECNLTILEADYLIDQQAEAVRSFLLRGLSDSLIRSKLEQLFLYRTSDFMKQVESVENRLMRFLTSKTMRRTMGVGTNALDFRSIMDQGKIVLVNLQPSDWLSSEQQRLFGTLLLTEFHEAALTRPSGAKPFYLYVDEAARFVTPELGEAFEQCRQKGLHLTLAFQHLAQFKLEDERVYKAIKNNARNKLVFAVPDRQDATELADDLFVGLTEPRLKFMHRRLNHRVIDTRETSTTRGIGTSKASTVSETRGRSFGTTRGTTEGTSHGTSLGSSQGTSKSNSQSSTVGLSKGRTFSRGRSFQTTSGQSHSSSHSESHSSGYSETSSHQENHGDSSSATTHEDNLRGGTQGTRDITRGESHNSAESHSRTDTGNDSYSDSESFSESTSTASGGNKSMGWSRTREQSETQGLTTGDTSQTSESENESQSHQTSRSASVSRSQSMGHAEQRGTSSSYSITEQPGTRHIPFLEEDPEHWSLEEQRWRATELIMRQPIGHWFAGTENGYGQGSTPMPDKFYISPDKMLALQPKLYEQCCISPMDADAILTERRQRLLVDSLAISSPPDSRMSVQPQEPSGKSKEPKKNVFANLLGKD